MKNIDINCDIGEGMANDELLMPFISSANIACGYHAGDEQTMRQTVALCIKYGVSIGAHPSFPDRENFGRREMKLSFGEVYHLIINQIIALEKILLEAGATLRHVKPHGALYNMAAKDPFLAAAIAQAVKDFSPKLVLFGLCNSHLIWEGEAIGLKTAGEAFADRTYQDDGSLTPRSVPGSLIEDPDQAVAQVLEIVGEGRVTTISGKKITIAADTICLHGDGANAAAIAKAIHEALAAKGALR
jgi:UPF0271 protein